ncbi:MAG: ATP-dependent helicase [Chloroflexi bacterium]|nr:MAG: ATP-dependent helicase [Chloroflexota bacterium]MBL1192766.1 DEAD/DEAH box helicase [Chloroflexota bacterium]NOH10060.1 DEAD/DEAH box helicase [Chloroflexota bacterium]
MNFNEFNLDGRLQAGIKHAGFKQPTPIQASAIPLALAGHDLIGTAQTGTGKTAAFVLPILHKLLKGKGKRTRALIITPTRELAEQIHQTIRNLSRKIHIRSVAIYGGVGANPQIEALHRGVEIVVACPGRLLDHINNKHAKLNDLDVLVLDEADRMFDMGFLPDIKRILQHVPAKRQTMLFSATFPKEIERLASQTLHKPQRVAIGLARPVHTVEHTLYPVPQHLKKGLLIKLLEQTDTNSVLIFTRTKRRAQRLAKQLQREDYKVTSLHSDRTQGQRRSALKGFKEGRYQIMIATDIAARGLDIDSISHVVNYDMPDTADAYIHRIGRTGRAKRSGEAFTMVTPDDRDMVRKIEKIMKQELPRQTLPDFDYTVPKPEYPPSKRKPRQHNQRNGHSRKSQRARQR